jgi:hypothetical protein
VLRMNSACVPLIWMLCARPVTNYLLVISGRLCAMPQLPPTPRPCTIKFETEVAWKLQEAE